MFAIIVMLRSYTSSTDHNFDNELMNDHHIDVWFFVVLPSKIWYLRKKELLGRSLNKNRR